jgi:hypothetical protein
MAKPAFDRAELIRNLNRTPIEGYMFDVELDNGKTVVISGKILVDYFCVLEHYEAQKVMEQWYWSQFYKMPLSNFLHVYAEALAKNGSLMTGILNFDIDLRKWKEEHNESTA